MYNILLRGRRWGGVLILFRPSTFLSLRMYLGRCVGGGANLLLQIISCRLMGYPNHRRARGRMSIRKFRGAVSYRVIDKRGSRTKHMRLIEGADFYLYRYHSLNLLF